MVHAGAMDTQQQSAGMMPRPHTGPRAMKSHITFTLATLISTTILALGTVSPNALAKDKQPQDHGENSVEVQVPAAWATLDANNDGVLTEEEVEATPWEQKFDDMDTDGDGEVTKQEFAEYEKHMRDRQAREKQKGF